MGLVTVRVGDFMLYFVQLYGLCRIIRFVSPFGQRADQPESILFSLFLVEEWLIIVESEPMFRDSFSYSPYHHHPIPPKIGSVRTKPYGYGV